MRLVTSLTLVQAQLKSVFIVSLIVVAAILGFTVASGLIFVRGIVVTLGQVERIAASIDRGIGKAAPQEETEPERKGIGDFQPYVGKKRKPGTGCGTEINDHLFEGRYSPIWPDGTQHSRNVYAHTREECEEKLKVLIVQMKAELAELKKRKAEGPLPPQPTDGKKGGK